MKLFNWILVGVTSAVLILVSSCKHQDLNPAALNPSDKATLTYKDSSEGYKKIELAGNEPLITYLVNWSYSNKSGWVSSFDTFVPGYNFQFTNISLNVRNDFVVANVKKSNGKWVQLKRPASPKFIKDLEGLIASREADRAKQKKAKSDVP